MDAGLLFIRDLAVVLLVAALVGALFRKMGLSPVVGYLVAGMVVGPYTPQFSLVTDPERVRTLSQLGLVFLMFFVGLGLSLRRIRQLGVPLLLATGITALLVFTFSRALAGALGWGTTPGLFLAAMLMVSSSAIITKTLSEAGLTHEKFAQRAMGITILEDVVAVVMITLLDARVSPDGASEGGIVGLGRVLGLLGGFVALLVVVGFLIVPRFLQRLARASDYDLKVSATAGMVLGVAFLAAWAGYSVALGAFLLGMVIAETPFRERIERGFGALQAMFSVIFFVSIGMLIDPRQIAAHWALVLGISFFAIAARALCATAAHMVTGRALTSALRTALVVTPIGEFSYIIAQRGVEAKAVPEFFYSLAVGVSAVTAFTAPLLLRGSEPLAQWVEARQPALWRGTQEAYRGWLAGMARRRRRSSLWLLTRSRIAQVVVELLLLVGILGFSPMVREALPLGLAGKQGATAGLVLYWAAVFAVALGLAVAVWRNLSAMGMILADAVFADARTKALVEGAVRFLSAAGLAVLFVLLLPLQVFGLWSAAILAGAMALFLVLFWRRLVRWHSHFLYSMKDALRAGEGKRLAAGKSVDEEEWGVDLVEVVVPEGASYSGQSLSDLALRSRYGCAVVEVERQGIEIANPRPDLALYPGDKLLLLGGEAAAARTRAFLEQGGGGGKPAPAFSESTLETVPVPDEGSRLGQSLAALRIFNETGVQVLGLRRDGATVLNPGAEEVLRPGDLLLLLANPAELAAFRDWLGR